MARIPGYFEWEDDDLTPGRRAGGGLHSNLFDEEGNLKGNARFFPDDGVGENHNTGVPWDSMSHAEDDQTDWRTELTVALIRELAPILIDKLVQDGIPAVVRWWNLTMFPFLDQQFRSLRTRIPRRRLKRIDPDVEILPPLEDRPSRNEAARQDRPSMTTDEETLRCIAVAAAYAFIEEQWEALSRSGSISSQQLDMMKQKLSGLSKDELGVLCGRARKMVTAQELHQLSQSIYRQKEIDG